MRLIIDYDAGHIVEQAQAAHSAIQGGLREGDIWGVRSDTGRIYGVKRNKDSVRVYPPRNDEQ